MIHMEAGAVELKWLTLDTVMDMDIITVTAMDMVTDTVTDTTMGVSDVMTTELNMLIMQMAPILKQL
jgi:hypothetical protein